MSTFPTDILISEHFAWTEFQATSPKSVPAAHVKNALKLCVVLERARKHFGKPVHITSGGGYRPYAKQLAIWNEALKRYGSEARARAHVAKPGHSQHEFFAAADIWIEGVTLTELAAFFAKQPEVGGIGIYPGEGFVHVDVRDRKGGPIARW